MQGIKPCPYCGGEVEVIKLRRNKTDILEGDIFRIECLSCRALVARGQKFPIENKADGKERIEQYYEAVKDKPMSSSLFPVNKNHHYKFTYNERY